MSTPSGPDGLDLRASDNERRVTTDRLSAAMAAGQLSPDEHADRTAQALAARTRGDLARLTADLPELPRNPAEVAADARRQRRVENWNNWRSWLAVAVLLNAIWLVSNIAGQHPNWHNYWPAWPLGAWGAVLLFRLVRPSDD